MIEIPMGVQVRPIFIEQRDQPGHCEVNTLDEEENVELPWFVDVQNYIAHGLYPEESSGKDRRAIRRFAAQFIICGGKLYKRSYEGTHQLCVDMQEGQKIIE